jgi:hypothetical protein
MDKTEFDSFIELKIGDITALVIDRKAFDFERHLNTCINPVYTAC